MLAQAVRRALGMLAHEVAIFRGEYLEIGHLEGAWNHEIDLMRAKVHREFPKGTVKQG